MTLILLVVSAWLGAPQVAAAGQKTAAEPPGAVLYPPLPQTPRLQFLKSYGSPKDVGQKDNWFTRFLFGKRREPSGLGKPYGIAAHAGKVYLCDTGNSDIRVIDLVKRETSWLGKPQGIQLGKPINIAIDEDGQKFVADTELKQVVVFGRDDKFVRSYEDPGWRPTDVAASSSHLYVLDIEKHQVRVIDRSSGAVTGTIGSMGSRDGEMFKPTNLARDVEGNLYVSDTINFRIQKFDASGKFVRSIGQLGRRPGEFARPKGIAVDREGRLYVVDAGFDNVQVLNPEGHPLIFIGGTGNDPGQMYLPAEVYLDYDARHLAMFQPLAHPQLTLAYLVWVTNQYGPRAVSVYGYGEWRQQAEIAGGR